MATTLSTLLTAAGCPVSAATTTVVIQNGKGQAPPVGSGRVDQITAAMLAGVATTSGSDARLSARINLSAYECPRCIAYDTSGGYVYVPVTTSNAFNPIRFVKIALTPTPYVASANLIPIITDNP